MDSPPPTYEEATGEPGLHNQINPYLKSVPATTPPPRDNELITAEPVTPTILSQPYCPTDQTNVSLHRETDETDDTNRNWSRAIIGIIVSLAILFFLLPDKKAAVFPFAS